MISPVVSRAVHAARVRRNVAAEVDAPVDEVPAHLDEAANPARDYAGSVSPLSAVSPVSAPAPAAAPETSPAAHPAGPDNQAPQEWPGWRYLKKFLLHRSPLRPALLRMALVVAVASGISRLFGEAAGLWLCAIGFGSMLVLHSYYVARLGAWLDAPRAVSLPDGVGVWASAFGRLYQTYRAGEQAQRRLAESEERYRRTVSALPEGIVVVNRKLEIEWCNPVAEAHLGISLQRDQGLRLTNLVRDPRFVAYMAGGRFEAPLNFTPIGRSGFILAVLVVEFEPERTIVVSRDITQSERVDAMRRDFVANVSHELRTPLTVVSGFLETLIDANPPLDELRRRHLGMMHEQSLRMHRLIEDLLLLSSLESDDKPRADEPVAIAVLLGELADEARALSQGRHQIVVEATSAVVRGSRDELRSAVGNLVSNAVRYTQPGGRVTLRWVARNDGGVIEVEDTGIGVAAEHIPRLTERFYRVEKSRSRETGGTGLGLAIVKHVVLRHNGRLEIRSRLGQGSTFGFWLPAARVAGLSPPTVGSGPGVPPAASPPAALIPSSALRPL